MTHLFIQKQQQKQYRLWEQNNNNNKKDNNIINVNVKIDDGVQDAKKALSSTSSLSSLSSTWDNVYQQYVSQAKHKKSFLSFVSNSLVVAQQVLLTALLLARHRLTIKLLSQVQMEQQISHQIQLSILISNCCIFAAIAIVVFINNNNTNQQRQRQHRHQQRDMFQRIQDFIFLAIFLRLLSAVISALTASYSSDTVYALTLATFALHVVACDYSYANAATDTFVLLPPPPPTTTTINSKKHQKQQLSNGYSSSPPPPPVASPNTVKLYPQRPIFRGGTISLTAAFFGTTLLTSRLPETANNNATVYEFVSLSVILFSLYPAARHDVSATAKTSYKAAPFLITLLFGAATFALLLDCPAGIHLLTALLFSICLFAPLWKYYLQSSKATLKGPWDIVHVPQKY